MRADAVETLGRPSRGMILTTCEHASNRVPRGWHATRADRALLSAHWGYDLGAAWVTRRVVHRTGGVGVLARASRLLVDVNRAPDDATLILADTHDGAPSFNRSVSAAERQRRTARFHEPFHATVAAMVRIGRPRLLVSVHSFTDVWQGRRREVEAGVLFDRHDAHALAMVQALRAQGLRTEANEPYSGKAGLIYSAARHGGEAGLPYFEIELRQDLLATRAAAEAVADRVVAALGACGW